MMGALTLFPMLSTSVNVICVGESVPVIAIVPQTLTEGCRIVGMDKTLATKTITTIAAPTATKARIRVRFIIVVRTGGW